MSRIKRGTTSRAKHKRLLSLTKGYRMTRHKLVKVAKESVLHAGEYGHSGRKLRKRDMRRMWISRLNQQVTQMDLSYSRFINALKKADLPIDRKLLSELAVNDPQVFKIIVDKVREQVN